MDLVDVFSYMLITVTIMFVVSLNIKYRRLAIVLQIIVFITLAPLTLNFLNVESKAYSILAGSLIFVFSLILLIQKGIFNNFISGLRRFFSHIGIIGTIIIVGFTYFLFSSLLDKYVNTEEEEELYFENCTDARSRGYSNINWDESGYRDALDRDNDGVGCER